MRNNHFDLNRTIVLIYLRRGALVRGTRYGEVEPRRVFRGRMCDAGCHRKVRSLQENRDRDGETAFPLRDVESEAGRMAEVDLSPFGDISKINPGTYLPQEEGPDSTVKKGEKNG